MVNSPVTRYQRHPVASSSVQDIPIFTIEGECEVSIQWGGSIQECRIYWNLGGVIEVVMANVDTSTGSGELSSNTTVLPDGAVIRLNNIQCNFILHIKRLD